MYQTDANDNEYSNVLNNLLLVQNIIALVKNENKKILLVNHNFYTFVFKMFVLFIFWNNGILKKFKEILWIIKIYILYENKWMIIIKFIAKNVLKIICENFITVIKLTLNFNISKLNVLKYAVFSLLNFFYNIVNTNS